MTAEVAFAKSFLATLDSKPVKLQTDHAADQKTIRPRGALTLPRMPQAMRPAEQQAAAAAGGGGDATSIIIKSSRNPPVNIQLDAQPLTMSILELKQKVAAEAHIDGTDKIRLLYNKKPCSDSKSIKDIVGEPTATTEFSVMFMGVTPGKVGGEAAASDSKSAETVAAGGTAVKNTMETEAFWNDLKGFLQQKLNNPSTAQQAVDIFRDAWKEKGKS